MAGDAVIAWAASQVKGLFPGLDGEPLNEAVKYSLSLSPEDTDRHWRSLLGSTPQVESFLKQLRNRRQPPPTPPSNPTLHAPIPQNRLPNAPPMSPSTSRGLSSSADTSRTPSPSKVLRITNNANRKKGPGKLTSDLGKPKPKAPALNPLTLAIEENRPLTDLEEIDSALQSITLSPKKRVPCGCFGTKHDVYPIAPNCLFCGRIYCVNEGLGKCFFCGEELVDDASKEELVRELKHERGVAKTKAANEKVRKVKAGESRHRVWATKVGGRDVVRTEDGSGGESDFAGSGVATPMSFDQGYIDAERKRDELLEFDRTFAERTKIIDQQAEFTPQMTLQDTFSTAQERAAALRRLQQMEAEQAAAERARLRRVLEIDFKSGKGYVRNASAEDLLAPTVKEIPMEDERRFAEGGSGTAEIVNGFAKPTFVETK